jgi:chromosome segregation ATPase
METCNATSPAANLETKLDSARKTIRGLETQLESMRSRLLPAIESRLEAFQQDQQKRAALKEQLSTHRLQTILFADAFPNLGADQQNLNKRQKTHPGFYLQGPKKMMSHPKVLKQVDALKRTIQSFTQQKLSG